MFKFFKKNKKSDGSDPLSYEALTRNDDFLTLVDLEVAIMSYAGIKEENTPNVVKMKLAFKNFFNTTRSIKLADNLYLHHEEINGINMNKLSAIAKNQEEVVDAETIIEDGLFQFYKATIEVMLYKMKLGSPIEVFDGVIFLWNLEKKQYQIAANENYIKWVLTYE